MKRKTKVKYKITSLVSNNINEIDFNYLPVVTLGLDNLQHTNFTMEDIRKITLWKLGRYPILDEECLNELNSLKYHKKLDEIRTKEVLEKLLENNFVGISMASAYLRFINPQVYQIIDRRAYRAAFDYKKYLSTTIKDNQKLIKIYLDYLKRLKQISISGYHCLKVKFEDLDRFLYDLDKTAEFNIDDKKPYSKSKKFIWKNQITKYNGLHANKKKMNCAKQKAANKNTQKKIK